MCGLDAVGSGKVFKYSSNNDRIDICIQHGYVEYSICI